MAADSHGSKNVPQYAGSGAPADAADLTEIAAYAAKVGNREADTSSVRTALGSSDLWEGLLFHEIDTHREYLYTNSGWSLWSVPRSSFTPVFTSLTVGTGSTAGYYAFSAGTLLTVEAAFTYGSGSGFAASPQMQTPEAMQMLDPLAAFRLPLGQAVFYDSSANTEVYGVVTFVDNTHVAIRPWDATQPYLQVNGETSTVPIPWATGDQMSFTFRALI